VGFAAKIAAFAALCYLFAHYVEKPLTEFAATRKRAPQRMLIIAGAGFLIAAGAGALGFSLAIGALFAGLMFSRDPRAIRTESGFDDIHDFFMPFFFVGIGLDTGFDGTTATFVLGAILFVTGVTAKVAGTALPALIFTSRQDALLLGVSMIPRAEIALVVAYQGLNLGTLTEEAYSAVVLASAATCILAPWLITALLRTRSYRQNQ
jgi:Kef-type K+ transport system membrane component KefB